MPQHLKGHGGPVKSVALSADGTRALTASFDYSVILWRIEGDEATVEKRLEGHEAAVNDAVFAGRGRAVSVSDDGSLAVWDLAAGTMLARFQGDGQKVVDVAVSRDARYAASAGWDDTARLYDIEKMKEIAVLRGHRGNVNAVDFAPDGTHLFSASYDGTIRSWSVPDGAPIGEVYDNGWSVNVLRALAGGRLVFGGLDGSLGVIDIARGDLAKVLPRHERPVLALAVSADGERAASGDGDGRIRVFSTRDWALEEEFDNPYGPVWGLALSRDGSEALYAGLDDFVSFWQVAPRKPFETVEATVPRRFQVEGADLGARQFARKCSVCHTLTPDDGNRAGPTLYRIFGRKAGSVAGYHYSPALERADIVWSEETIARLFDEGPDVVTPGSKMPMQRIRSLEERDALIAFLKKATAPGAGQRRQGEAGKNEGRKEE
ncbi:c-type cytochrome [Breoghania sp. JC706]|uniref:c-type cytochrome n=1 Tax=Breoghania sp. JC706 TaxID=3117732 RepID=UPI003008FFEE